MPRFDDQRKCVRPCEWKRKAYGRREAILRGVGDDISEGARGLGVDVRLVFFQAYPETR